MEKKQAKKFKKAPEQASTKKKIGLLSTIIMVAGASIGSGVFFKTREIYTNVQSSFILAIVSWVIALIAVFAMALALIEICSANDKANDEGIIGWVKTFNRRYLYIGAKNFMAYIYLPTNFFLMACYAMMSIQDGIGAMWKPIMTIPWWAIMLISIGICIWFSTVSGLSIKAGNIQSLVISSIKFLPIIFVLVIGFVLFGIGKGTDITPLPQPPTPEPGVEPTPLFNQLSPGLGLFVCIPAIFFAFDGFYTTASVQSSMKQPKKIASALGIGLAIVAFINVGISISLMLCSKEGAISDIEWLKKIPELTLTLNLLIGVGILGIINAFAIYCSLFYQQLLKEKNVVFYKPFQKLINPNNRIAGVAYTLCLGISIIVFCSVIGALLYLPMYADYNKEVNQMYSFADLVANWTSVFAFGFIVLAVVGCLMNRKNHKVKVVKSKYFVPCAWITTIVVGVALAFVVVSAFGDVILSSIYFVQGKYKGDISTLISCIMKLVMLVVCIGVMTIPQLIMKVMSSKHKLSAKANIKRK